MKSASSKQQSIISTGNRQTFRSANPAYVMKRTSHTISIYPFFIMMMNWACVLGSSGASAQVSDPGITLHTGPFGAGAGEIQGDGVVLMGTLGQPLQGRLSGSGAVSRTGFWHQVRPVGPVAVTIPIAVADSVATDEDTSVDIDMLANDLDPAGNALVLLDVTQPSDGNVDSTGLTSVRYTPDANFNGQDSFTYVISNTQGGTAHGVVTVTVRPVNDAPVFTSEPVTGAAANQTYAYNVEAHDVDGQTPKFTFSEMPEWLALTDHGDGTATLEGTPTNEEVGEHDVVLVAKDDDLSVEQAFTVTVILGAPAAPRLVAPADGAVDVPVTVTLEWGEVAGAETYDVQLATTEDFSEIIVDETDVDSTSLVVSDLEGGTTYFWRARAVNRAGASAYAGPFRFTVATAVPVEEEADVPERFELRPNYPNPFNPATVIPFSVPQTTRIRLTVHDLMGRELFVLVDNARFAPGNHSVRFDATDLSSGTYIYRLEAGKATIARKMLLIK